MSIAAVKEALEKQLQLLSECSEKCALPEELAALTAQMVNLCEFLLTLD